MIWLLGLLGFGIVGHRPGPGNVVFAVARNLPAPGFAHYPFAMVRLSDVQRALEHETLDLWLREVWLEEWFHCVQQQRLLGPMFYLLYGMEWLADLAARREPYKDSSLENHAKRWVVNVLAGREPNPIANLDELVLWTKAVARR